MEKMISFQEEGRVLQGESKMSVFWEVRMTFPLWMGSVAFQEVW